MPVFRLGLGDLQHHGKAVVLLRLGDVSRLAGQRIIAALDLEAVGGGRLRRDRRARYRDHRLHRRFAGVGDPDRLAGHLGGLVAAEHRLLDRGTVDVERQRFPGKGTCRQHHPGVLLRGGVGRKSARGLDSLDRLRQRRPWRAAFAGKRHESGGIAQRAAIVGAAKLDGRLGIERIECGTIHPLRPRLVADQGERRRKL